MTAPKSFCPPLIGLCFMLVTTKSIAQPVTVPDNTYGPGGTRTTTTSTDAQGNVTTTIEYHNGFQPPKLKEKIEITKIHGGDSTVTRTYYDEFMAGQGKDSSRTIRYNANGDIIMDELIRFGPDGDTPASGTKWDKQPDGRWFEYRYNPKTGKFERVRSRPRRIRENGVGGYLACDSARFEWGFGHSTLASFNNNNNEWYLLGFQVHINYNVSNRLAIIGDLSGHFKKLESIEPVNLTSSFFLGGLLLRLHDLNSPHSLLPAVRLLAGINHNRTKYSPGDPSTNTSTATSAAFGSGLVLDYRLKERLLLYLMADCLLANSNDEWNTNLRFGLGLKFRAGCK